MDKGDQGRRLSDRGRRRLTTVIILSVVVILLMLSLIAQSGFNLSPILSPNTAGETLLLYGLSSLNFLAFITLFFVLLRNVLKLVRERRAGRLGSKFKARLVIYALGLSLLPVLLLFFFSFGLINRSIDRWFGEPTRQIVDDSHILEDSYFKREQRELISVARAVAQGLSLKPETDYASPVLAAAVKQQMANYDLALVRLVKGDNRVTIQNGNVEPDIEDTLKQGEIDLKGGGAYFEGKDDGASPSIIYAIAAVRVMTPDGPAEVSDPPGAGVPRPAPAAGTNLDQAPILILAREFPRAANIDEHYSKIDNLRKKLKPVKDIQILLLALVTLLLLFSAVWVALHLARGITVPIQALAEATSRVARGDFSHPIDVVAEDELAALVQSFNQMANQLSRNRELLEDAAEDLSRTNLALLDRRGYIETVLESLSTGVISMGEGMGIATINLAAVKILGFQERPAPGTPIKELVAGHRGDELAALCRRARRAGRANTEIEFVRSDGSSIQTATTSIALQTTEGDPNGWVIVIEDLTDLIQAERAAAWSEVARRMAHEIKNPLTPIQLSAERIMRNYNRAGDGENGKFGEIVKDGTSTIVREVGTLQRMVEEFSRFARLPEARPVEGSLNSVIEDAVRLYSDRLEGIRLEVSLDDRMPLIYLDPEQIKRVMVNLIENAVEALGGDALREVGGNGAKEHGSHPQRLMEIVSTYVKGSDTARIVVSDTGHGIKGVDRDKLFQPKFSTRSRGTGLGLAIVSHIISDHKGRIWVEENKPRGARFIIELPAG